MAFVPIKEVIWEREGVVFGEEKGKGRGGGRRKRKKEKILEFFLK